MTIKKIRSKQFNYQISVIIIIIMLIGINLNSMQNDRMYLENENLMDITSDLEETNDINKNIKNIYLVEGKDQKTRGETSPPKVDEESITYAIICPENLISTVQPLADWKTKKGVPTKIFITDGPNGIYARYSDGDNATKIHDFLTEIHENNSKFQWVLIVGDEDIIPSRKIFVNAKDPYGLDDFYYSDHYYAGLNNSWDQDGDGIYGEQKGDVNWYADLYIGRLPVNNASEANIAINKIISYETTPVMGSWMRNATFWSGLLDGPNNQTAYQSYKDNAIKVTNKIIKNVPDYMNINHLYDYDQLEGGNYTFENDSLNHRSGKASFYAGNSFINFAGQAYYTSDELAHYDDETGISSVPNGFGPLFSYNDGKFSTNGMKLSFLYLSTCSVNFSENDDSNLEQLITAPNGGVIGLIGNSGKTYRGETKNGSSFGNWWLNEQFWEMFFNGTTQPGKGLYKLKERYNMEVIFKGVPYVNMAVANLVGYNLLGDPELNIWTDIPKKLVYNFTIIKEEDYNTQIIVKNDLGKPVENARVCVYNKDFYEFGSTNDEGEIILDIDPRNAGLLEVTITAHNFLPLFSNFTYENQPPIFYPINDLTIKEDNFSDDHIFLSYYIKDLDKDLDDLEIYISKNTFNESGVRIDANYNLDIFPQKNWFGETYVTIRVSDGLAYAEYTLKITIDPVNDAPRFIDTPKSQTIKAGSRFEYTFTVFDVENDTLEFSDNTQLFDINSKTGKIDFKTTNDNAGTHNITISVFDGAAITNYTFELTIESVSTFLEEWWFPILVITATIVIILFVKIYEITHRSKDEVRKQRDKENGKEKKDMKKYRNPTSKKMIKRTKNNLHRKNKK